jgi:CRISPR-associated protein Cas5d
LRKKPRVEHWSKTFCLEIAGDYACFTRPELKVERVSYDVITPSAARGVFTAVFWKPAIRWRVRRLEVLNPIRFTSVRRNEVGAVAVTASRGIFVEDERQQRAGLVLRDVAYRIHAALEFIPPASRTRGLRPVPEAVAPGWDKNENPGKYYGMFERRARKGQCFNQPYLGCREFSASFRFVEHAEQECRPIDETRDLGFMLYDLDFADETDPKPAFFRARMQHGAIDVPSWDDPEVRR